MSLIEAARIIDMIAIANIVSTNVKPRLLAERDIQFSLPRVNAQRIQFQITIYKRLICADYFLSIGLINQICTHVIPPGDIKPLFEHLQRTAVKIRGFYRLDIFLVYSYR